MIYNFQEKDRINLLETDIRIDKVLPFTPDAPYPFVMEKTALMLE